MCGRFVSSASTADLADALAIDVVHDTLPDPSFNVAPTHAVRTVVQVDQPESDTPGTALAAARWGFVPNWAKTLPSKPMINARSETLLEKPYFKHAALRRRVLVPADGWFEWHRDGAHKTPFYMSGSGVLLLAGVASWWQRPELPSDDPMRWLHTVAVVTQSASSQLAHIHHRMPVVVPPDLAAVWLDRELTTVEGVMDVLQQCPEPPVNHWQVSSDVGAVRNNGPALIAPV